MKPNRDLYSGDLLRGFEVVIDAYFVIIGRDEDGLKSSTLVASGK